MIWLALEIQRKKTELSELSIEYDNLIRSVGVASSMQARVLSILIDEKWAKIQALRKEIHEKEQRLKLMMPDSWFWY